MTEETIGSLCTGYGGLDMAVQSVFGGRLLWWSDVDPGPVNLMTERHPGVPNLGDLKHVDWHGVPWVHTFTAGYPCQPFSNAGKRLGLDDPRHLWPWIAYAIAILRPRRVVLENVAAHLGRGFRVVAEDLAALGYRPRWTTLRASDVGAPHRRERLFVVADAAREHDDRPGYVWSGRRAEHPNSGGQVGGGLTLLPTPRASDGEKGGPNQRGSSGDPMLPNIVHKLTLLPTPTAAIGMGSGRQTARMTSGVGSLHLPSTVYQVQPDPPHGSVDWREYEPAIRRWESVLGRPAPYPASRGPRGGVKVSPAFVEWMMGLPPGHVSSADYLTINEMLKLLGNGVVPPQAECAIRDLTESTKRGEMTTPDTSSFFTAHQSRDVPRDQWGRYKLPGPGGQEESWTRATTFAATLAEQYGLRIWKERQVVWGLSRRPDLMTVASTIVGPEDKKALGEIVTEAHIAAGTDAKANRGTAIHLACAAAERGAWDQVPEELRPHVADYLRAMREGGLEILPQYVERTGIVKLYGVAGTLDNLVRCPDGKLRVSDKKTGRLDYSDVEFSVQMAVYAHFDALFNYDTGAYEQMPEVATDYAILAHIDPVSGKTELQRINIEWGWVWAKTCAEVRDIRQTKHVITPYVAPERSTGGAVSTTTTQVLDAANAGGNGQPAPSYAPDPVAGNMTGQPIGIVNAAQPFGTATLPGAVGHTVPPTVQAKAPIVEYVTQDGQTAQVSAGTVPGGYVDSTSPVPAEIQAFWSDDRHDVLSEDEFGAPTLNGVPVEQFGQPSTWGCSRGEPCEFTGDEGLHSDGTVCLYGNARPGPIPPLPSAEPTEAELTRQAMSLAERAQEPVPGEAPELDDTEVPDNVDAIAKAMNKLSKGSAQDVARKVMAAAGVAEGKPGSIKLSQYKSKVINETITLAHRHSLEIPGAAENDPPFGTPTGPAPGTSGAKPAAAAQSPDDQREEKIRTAVESIRQQNSIAGLQERHAYYSGTSIGWTDEMQTAARTRAAAIELENGETSLSPLEMIQGATSRETLSKAWDKATGGGSSMAGWTEELNAAALAKQTELSGGTQ